MPNLLGLRTVVYAAPDLDEAKAWYQNWLGQEPYFDQPFYVGFNVGGYELGLDPDATPANKAQVFWGVPHMQRAVEWAMTCGAGIFSGVEEVGGGIKVCTIKDPFGNFVGLIENPHFELPV